MRRTKILVTVGPATSAPGVLAGLLEAGTDAFRLNFSHGTDAEHWTTLRLLHTAIRATGRSVAVVADLQGPKIRLGGMDRPRFDVHVGDRWEFQEGNGVGGPGHAYVSLPGMVRAAHPGDRILLGDGAVEMAVTAIRGATLEAEVVHGGSIGPHLGFFLPGAQLRTNVLGPKDRADLELAVAEGVDFIALSFVRDAADLRLARRAVDARPGGRAVGIIAKIERAEALAHIDGILEVADGVMVARGDLGIEVPLERLALEQKRLVQATNSAGAISIVATQMLLSMVTSSRPTRAEATDVANAVIDGTDCVMLSEETAVGQYPVEAVGWLDRICQATEGGLFRGEVREAPTSIGALTIERSVAAAAAQLAEQLGASAIVTPTHSGRTARLISKFHPRAPILALSSEEGTRRRLSLVRGVASGAIPGALSILELTETARDQVRGLGADPAGPIVLTAGYPVEGRPTNLVTVLEPLRATTRRGGPAPAAAGAGSRRRRSPPS